MVGEKRPGRLWFSGGPSRRRPPCCRLLAAYARCSHWVTSCMQSEMAFGSRVRGARRIREQPESREMAAAAPSTSARSAQAACSRTRRTRSSKLICVPSRSPASDGATGARNRSNACRGFACPVARASATPSSVSTGAPGHPVSSGFTATTRRPPRHSARARRSRSTSCPRRCPYPRSVAPKVQASSCPFHGAPCDSIRYRGADWRMRRAANAAPNPLSMLQTTTPAAQLVSMPAKAASPPTPTP